MTRTDKRIRTGKKRFHAKYQHKEGSRPSLREDSRATLGRGVYESVRVLRMNTPLHPAVSAAVKV
jgi:hypothetical protein